MMGLIRKIITWVLVILSALILALFTEVLADLPFWTVFILFAVYLAIIIISIHFIRKKIYQHRTGFIETASTVKSEQNDLYTTYLQTLHTISSGNNKAAKKRFFNEPWVLYFEMGNDNLSDAISQYEVLPTTTENDPEPGSARWFKLSNLVLIKPNQSLVDSHAYDSHWMKFLETIKRHRSDAPFNKIIISLSVKTLINEEGNGTDENKASVQKYIDIIKLRLMQITDITGYKIPIVIVLSDLDLLSGYAKFTELLSSYDKQQAIGLYNRGDDADFTANIMTRMADTLDNFIDRIAYERKETNPIDGYEFIYQLRELQKGWDNIDQIMFDQGLSKSLLSGLFFLGAEAHAKGDKKEYIFSHDLFTLILTKQNLLPFLTEAEQQKQDRNVRFKLSVIYTLVLLFILYVIMAFITTSRNLTGLLRALPQHIQYTTNFEQNLLAMTEYNNMMTSIIAFRQHWTVAIFPYNAGLNKLEKIYTKQFVENFQQNVVAILDKDILDFLRVHNNKLTSLQRAYLVQNLVSRINILQAKLNKQPYSYIQKLNSPELQNLGFSSAVNFENFGALYKTYVFWQPNADILRKEKGQLTDELVSFKLLTSGDVNMQWLVDWANTQSTISPLTLSNFWHGDKRFDTMVNVPPAYTHAGKNAIDSLMIEINNAVATNVNLAYEQQSFQEWYEEQRLNAWYRFALDFNRGVESLNYKTQWDYFYNPFIMLSTEGPYYKLLDTMYSEFINTKVKTRPIWLQQLEQFYILLNYQVTKNKLDSARDVAAVTRTLLHQIVTKPSSFKSATAVGATYRQNIDNEFKAAQAFISYQTNLNSLYSQAVSSEGQLFGISKAIYDTNSGKADKEAQTILKAFDSYNTMRQILSNIMDQNSVFWLLLRGPFDYYVDYVNRYGSCYMQQQWVAEVLTPTNGLVGDELTNTLFGQSGLAWAFLTKYANSFLQVSDNLFVPQIMWGHIFPFTDSFYDFINSGITIQAVNREQAQFENYFNKNGPRLLTISSSATNVNADAKLLPYQTILTSVCSKQTIEIKNFNFPSSENIKWNLGECGAAQIAIYFNGFIITKDYPGKFGFAEFLRDFAKGSQTYQASDFPENVNTLQAYNVNTITVNYQISGLSDILYKLDQFFAMYKKLLNNEKRYLVTGAVPTDATLCWNSSAMARVYNQEADYIKSIAEQTAHVEKSADKLLGKSK